MPARSLRSLATFYRPSPFVGFFLPRPAAALSVFYLHCRGHSCPLPPPKGTRLASCAAVAVACGPLPVPSRRRARCRCAPGFSPPRAALFPPVGGLRVPPPLCGSLGPLAVFPLRYVPPPFGRLLVGGASVLASVHPMIRYSAYGGRLFSSGSLSARPSPPPTRQ